MMLLYKRPSYSQSKNIKTSAWPLTGSGVHKTRLVSMRQADEIHLRYTQSAVRRRHMLRKTPKDGAWNEMVWICIMQQWSTSSTGTSSGRQRRNSNSTAGGNGSFGTENKVNHLQRPAEAHQDPSPLSYIVVFLTRVPVDVYFVYIYAVVYT